MTFVEKTEWAWDTSHLADPTAVVIGVNVLTARADPQSGSSGVCQSAIGCQPVRHDRSGLDEQQAERSLHFVAFEPAPCWRPTAASWVLDARRRAGRAGLLAHADASAANRLERSRSAGTGLALVRPIPQTRTHSNPGQGHSDRRCRTFARLEAEDRGLSHLFRVLVDFDISLGRDDEGLADYVRFLGSLVANEQLAAF